MHQCAHTDGTTTSPPRELLSIERFKPPIPPSPLQASFSPPAAVLLFSFKPPDPLEADTTANGKKTFTCRKDSSHPVSSRLEGPATPKHAAFQAARSSRSTGNSHKEYLWDSLRVISSRPIPHRHDKEHPGYLPRNPVNHFIPAIQHPKANGITPPLAGLRPCTGQLIFT